MTALKHIVYYTLADGEIIGQSFGFDGSPSVSTSVVTVIPWSSNYGIALSTIPGSISKLDYMVSSGAVVAKTSTQQTAARYPSSDNVNTLQSYEIDNAVWSQTQNPIDPAQKGSSLPASTTLQQDWATYQALVAALTGSASDKIAAWPTRPDAVDPTTALFKSTAPYLPAQYLLLPDSGIILATGNNIVPKYTRVMSVTTGYFKLSGLDFATHRITIVTTGYFTATGKDTTVLKPDRGLTVDTGQFFKDGFDITIMRTANLSANTGFAIISGQDSTKQGDYLLQCELGYFTTAGEDVTLTH